MKNSKIDELISDRGWKGIATRLSIAALVYYGFAVLPSAVAWSSVHFGTVNASASQLAKRLGMMHVIRIVGSVMLVFEAINVIRLLRKRPP
jgi:hypothetical protein